jgi:hypothetical protein
MIQEAMDNKKKPKKERTNQENKQSNGRKWLWNKRNGRRWIMERAQRAATNRAKDKKDIKNKFLSKHLSKWDAELTSKQLHDMFLTVNYKNKKLEPMKFQSFVDRISRKGMMRFDYAKKVWINLTLLQLPEP